MRAECAADTTDLRFGHGLSLAILLCAPLWIGLAWLVWG
jgi:hypothetical protein